MNKPVRLHSPRTQLPQQKENSPNQNNAIPFFSNRVTARDAHHSRIPMVTRTPAKSREKPMVENNRDKMALELPTRIGWRAI